MLAFAGASYGTALFVQPTALVKTMGLNFINAYLIARLLMTGARLLLSPYRPDAPRAAPAGCRGS